MIQSAHQIWLQLLAACYHTTVAAVQSSADDLGHCFTSLLCRSHPTISEM